LLPSEQARVAELKEQGVLEIFYLSHTKKDIWGIYNGDSLDAVRIESILKILGPEGLLTFGKVNMSLLEEFMAKSFLNKSEFNKYRRLVNVTVK
jgi:hypothetical protein